MTSENMPQKPRLYLDYHQRLMVEADIPALIDICKAVYPDEKPYTIEQLADHIKVFPEGQFVVEHTPSGQAVGVQATLIIRFDDYGMKSSWQRLTDNATFLNHDPEHGHTLYGAEMMVSPAHQHHGLSHSLIDAAREFVMARSLWRMRAGSRIPGYHLHADTISTDEYVRRVTAGELDDPVLSVHLREGWRVLGVEKNYLATDWESGGDAALIEWMNPKLPMPV